MLAVLPGCDTHHVEVIRINHRYRRSRVSIKVVVILIVVIVDCSTWHSWRRSTPWPWRSWRRPHRTPPHTHLLFPQRELALPHLQLALPQRQVRLIERRCRPASVGDVIVDNQMTEFFQIVAIQRVSLYRRPRVAVGWPVHRWPVHRWSTVTVSRSGIR